MSEQARIAVVTGGNRGIGLEICRQLAEHGVHVVLTARDPASGERAAEELKSEGLDVTFQPLDVRDERAVHALAAYLQERHGGLDILVNNAGVALSGFDVDVVRTTIETNVLAPLRLTDTLLPLMRQGGRIVMVSSGMGEQSYLGEELSARLFREDLERDEFVAIMRSFIDDVAAGVHEQQGWPSSAYRVSKAALNKMTELLGHELDATGNPRGILVNAACPGWVRTDMGGPHAPRLPGEGADTPVWLALLGSDGPQGGFFRDREPASW